MPFSSGVWFSDAPWFWRINGLHYDLIDFLDSHPGGAEAIRTIRERFGGDCTEAFYAHHLNAERALRVLEPFRVVRHDDAIVPPPASRSAAPVHAGVFATWLGSFGHNCANRLRSAGVPALEKPPGAFFF